MLLSSVCKLKCLSCMLSLFFFNLVEFNILLSKCSNECVDLLMVIICFCCFLFNGLFIKILLKLIIVFIGVWILWFIFVINDCFVWVVVLVFCFVCFSDFLYLWWVVILINILLMYFLLVLIVLFINFCFSS